MEEVVLEYARLERAALANIAARMAAEQKGELFDGLETEEAPCQQGAR
jgi:hypothetical protein